ncbi:MAG: hypothetical protein ACO3H6_02070 [Bacilli bacterium]
MKDPTLTSIENYYGRFRFPGGIKFYPLDYLSTFSAKRTVSSRFGGVVKTKQGDRIAFESGGERREILRALHILDAHAIKTQAIELVTLSGKRFYPDLVVQLQDGQILLIEIKHIMDFIWDEVIEKYQTMMRYCQKMGWGCALLDGKWKDFHYVEAGNTLHFPQVIEWIERNLIKKNCFTLKDLRAKFPQEKYWSTVVGYCLMNGYRTHVSFRHPAWAIERKSP